MQFFVKLEITVFRSKGSKLFAIANESCQLPSISNRPANIRHQVKTILRF